MKYVLHSPLSKNASTPAAEIEKLSAKWLEHPFYKSDLVLGLDIGIEGIGIWLRKGPTPLFAQTIVVELPEASPLAKRRANRAARRSRVSCKKREAMLKNWIVKYGLLTEVRVNEIWENPSIFQRGFEHRYRAIQKSGALKSHEALVSCIRHCLQHRGFDYHMSNDSAFPWGDGMDDASQIIQWAKRAICPPGAVKNWKQLFSDAAWSDKEEKWEKVMAALDETVRRYGSQPIETHLEKHFREKNHPNLREAARGENFPRELIKEHLRLICNNHESFFGSKEKLDAALTELLGESDQKLIPGSIIDFHRKTQSEIESLWKRKTNDCPFIPFLATATSPAKEKCSPNSSPEIRRFKLLQFLAERTFVAMDGNRIERTYANADLYAALMGLLETDISATLAATPAPSRTKLGKRDLKKLVETAAKAKLAPDSVSHNADFFEQLSDLLFPKLSVLKERAALSKTAARHLIEEGMEKLSEFQADRVRGNWAETYYQWRRNVTLGGPIYPQVELLLGNPRQYDNEGKTKDRNGSNPQQHGILRRLFAGQFKDAHGNTVDLSPHLGGKMVPDFIIIETLGDIPRNATQRRDLQREQKDRREAKDKIFEKYGLPKDANSDQIKRALLFDQQTGKDGRAVCPYTGADLGDSALATDLEIEHIYPRELGGISEMLNLVLTKRQTNGDKGKNTPFQIAGKTIGHTSFSSWTDMKKRVESSMKWKKAKRELFCREETTCPDWSNTTRVAQLARQLRDQVIRWLNLDCSLDENERANEIARRIGTPSGAMTAACRESWKEALPDFMSGKKDRSNFRHHLYDAAVISHIPPREGMNLASCGGIFVSDFASERGWMTIALPGLLPDLNSFQKATQNVSLVSKPKSGKSKASRYDSTIYSPADSEGERWTRFKGDLAEWRVDPKMSLEKIKQCLRAAGITADKLPDKLIEKWYHQEPPKDASAQPLRFPSFKDGVHGQKIESVTRKSTKPCAEPAYGPHFDAKGNIIGWKVAQESFIRCEIWMTENPGKNGVPEAKFYQRRTFHPRHLVNLRKRQLADGRFLSLKLPLSELDLHEIGLVAEAEELKKLQDRLAAKVQKGVKKCEKNGAGIDLFESGDVGLPAALPLTTSLQEIYCEPTPIPTTATKVGCFRKGQVLVVPLDSSGKFHKRGTLRKNAEPAGGWWAYAVTSIKSGGEIEMKLAEYKPAKPDEQSSRRKAPDSLRPTSSDDLAFLLELQGR